MNSLLLNNKEHILKPDGIMTFKTLSVALFGSAETSLDDIQAITAILENLQNKGMMRYEIIYNDENLAESLIAYCVDPICAKAFAEGRFSFQNLSQTIN